MSKKKQLPASQEDEFFDQMMFDDEGFDSESDMINTFGQVADASVEHMKVAYRLTKLIVKQNPAQKLSTDEILEVFRKSAATILDCTPLKALFEGKT
jgi:hypothetical protein